MKYLLGCLLAAVLGLVPLVAGANDADARFHAIYSQEWAWRTGQSGISSSGEIQPGDGRLDSVDAATQQARLERWQQVLKDLDAIDLQALSPGERVNFEVYRAQIANLLADQRFEIWQMPFNSDSSFWGDISYQLHGDHLRTVDDYQRYLDRLGQIPAYFDQQIANMRAGLKRGFSVPRAVLDGRDVSIAAVADLADPTDSSFYAPFKHLPDSIPDDRVCKLLENKLARVSVGCDR